jgi:hypothetical protein
MSNIIEKSTIVELSRYTSINTKSNSEWTNKIPPIEINEDDAILIKQSFIDTRLIDSTSIEVLEDTTINFQFIYWFQGHGINLYRVSINPGVENTLNFETLQDANAVDGLPYMLVDIRPSTYPFQGCQGRPVVDTQITNIKKGIYERGNLCDIISKQWQGINQPTYEYITAGKQTFTSGIIEPLYTPTTPGNYVFEQFSMPVSPPVSNQIISTFSKQLYLAWWAGDGESPDDPYKLFLFYIDSEGNEIPCLLKPMTDNPNYPEIPLGQILATSSVDDVGDITVGFTEINGYSYNFVDAGYIGSNIPSIQYNQNNGDGKFSMILHSPILDSGNPSVGTYTYMNNSEGDEPTPQNVQVSYLNAYSGVMFVNVYDKFSYKDVEVTFLNQMGITRNDIIPSDVRAVFAYNNNYLITTNPIYFSYYNSFIPYTTRGIMTINNITYPIGCAYPKKIFGGGTYSTLTSNGSVFFVYPNQEGYYFTQSDNFTNLSGSSFPISSPYNSGHYLVDISAWNLDYINENKLLCVKTIVGNYFYSENFAMTLAPDSAIYTHSGLPMSLSGVNIRILNAITKEPASNLGTNSCIYLQIVKRQTIEQPKK